MQQVAYWAEARRIAAENAGTAAPDAFSAGGDDNDASAASDAEDCDDDDDTFELALPPR